MREAFEERYLRFRVDRFVWNAPPQSFRERIQRTHQAVRVLLLRERRWSESRKRFGPPDLWERRPASPDRGGFLFPSRRRAGDFFHGLVRGPRGPNRRSGRPFATGPGGPTGRTLSLTGAERPTRYPDRAGEASSRAATDTARDRMDPAHRQTSHRPARAVSASPSRRPAFGTCHDFSWKAGRKRFGSRHSGFRTRVGSRSGVLRHPRTAGGRPSACTLSMEGRNGRPSISGSRQGAPAHAATAVGRAGRGRTRERRGQQAVVKVPRVPTRRGAPPGRGAGRVLPPRERGRNGSRQRYGPPSGGESAPHPPGRWGSRSLRGRIPMRGALSAGCWDALHPRAGSEDRKRCFGSPRKNGHAEWRPRGGASACPDDMSGSEAGRGGWRSLPGAGEAFECFPVPSGPERWEKVGDAEGWTAACRSAKSVRSPNRSERRRHADEPRLPRPGTRGVSGRGKIRARLRLDSKKVLRKRGYPPDGQRWAARTLPERAEPARWAQ